jgi:DNA-binding response OmpR family regulator
VLDTPPVCTALLVCLSGLPDHARQILEEDGFWVSVAREPVEARWRLQTLGPDLVLVQLEGRRPAEWQECQRLIEVGSQPVFVLVEDGAVEARLAALASGADDVLSQPYHRLELVGRARALLRRGRPRQPRAATLRHADLELDLEGHLATLRGGALPLTPLEFRLLRTLLEAPRRTFSRDELLAQIHVFDERFSSERSIDLHVTELRRKLGDSASQPDYIQTVRGVGYRLAQGRQRLVSPNSSTRSSSSRSPRSSQL